MAQADFFKNFMNSGGVLQEAYEKGVVSLSRMRDIQDEMNTQVENMAKVRSNMWKADYKGQKITERLASTAKKALDHTKKINEMKKKQLIAEKELEKIDQKIKSAPANSKYQKALIKQYNATQLTYQKNQASLTLMKKATPLLGKLGGIGGGLAEALGSLGSVIPIIGGIVGGLMKLGSAIFGMIIAPFKKGFQLFLQTQSLVGNLAADIGLTAAQSKNLLNNIVGMSIAAMKFGGSMEDVIGIYRQFSSITGKNMFFNEKEIAAIVELGKGTGLGVDGAAEMAASFENIGISLGRTIKLTDRARSIAAKYNINVTDLLKTYKGLVVSLTGIGFGKGLDNLTKLAAKAQAIRFDIVSSTKAFSDAFFDPEKAVEASAQMQLLGGRFAASFGDPMQLAFESMNNPEQLAIKFAELLKDSVVKGKDGVFSIPPAERQMLRIASEKLGQNYEDILNSTIEQAKISDKMVSLSKAGLMGLKDDDKLAIASLMKMNEKGKYEIQMSDGTTKLIENITDKNQLTQILENRKKNDLAAQGRMNLVERLENMINRFTLGFTNVFNKIFTNMDFDNFLTKLEGLGTSLAEIVFPAIEKILNNKGVMSNMFTSILDTATEIVGAITKIWTGDATFLDKIVGTIGTLIIKLFEVVKPYVQMALGKLLDIVGSALPDWAGGTKMKNAGLQMQQNAIMNDKTGVISGLYGKNGVEALAAQMNENETSGILKTGGFKAGTNLISGAAGFGMKGLNSVLKGSASPLAKIGAMGGMKVLSKIPVLGSIVSAGFAISDLLEGDYTGAMLQGGSAIANLANLVAPGWGTAASLALDAADTARQVVDVKDALVTPHGIIRGDKGDMWMALQANGMGLTPNGGGFNSPSSVEHSGVIRIQSDDGKVVTWDQMYAARDLIAGRIDSYDKVSSFGNYQSPNKSPIQPLIV